MAVYIGVAVAFREVAALVPMLRSRSRAHRWRGQYAECIVQILAVAGLLWLTILFWLTLNDYLTRA